MDAVLPGERLGTTEEFTCGNGTYERDGYVYSTLVGFPKKRASDDEKKPPVITIVSIKKQNATVLPEIGMVVTCKVSSINYRMAKVAILGVEDRIIKDTFRGTIRKEDVRATERDKVEIQKSFRPGDIVRAKVISLGDAQSRSYFLSTAENSLGVIVAESETGVPMVPISWCQMQCPQTKLKEYRKVAKVTSSSEIKT
ncbi:exosome complex component CSL4-like [Oscarella lobularis]|uniref:exosome complex component CSL4-like n=1 Tax=Oscarella lobularis TaxID=121494 RepID=UPI00331379A8